MQIWHEELSYDFSEQTTNHIFTEQTLFFDIETTGFSPANSTVYLIGCASRKGSTLMIDQFFAETPLQEEAALSAFFAYAAKFDTLITFNGLGFDIPYLKGRCKHYRMQDPFSVFACIDIFKIVSRMKFLFALPNYKQKSLEQFLGIEREDLYSGGELIAVYRSYVQYPSDDACHLLKLHNYEDVLGMPSLLPLLAYDKLFSGAFSLLSVSGNTFAPSPEKNSEGKELVFTLKNEFPLPKRVSCSGEDFSLTAHGSQTVLLVRLYEEELKFFFPDYQNYYYLPKEDVAVRKEVASSVEKPYRKNATANTCYQKKYALFLPQYEELETPAFRKNRKDKKSYFALSEEFVQSEKRKDDYVRHVLGMLSGGRLSSS
ncbi:MAG: ribonuclease H-like domain-containing protein [Clostridiales bacterium]|nr:ribonuclease H-like domain-containing protein [Clostridiales bacterium]